MRTKYCHDANFAFIGSIAFMTSFDAAIDNEVGIMIIESFFLSD